MNTQEKIEAAGKKKEEGNALFKAAKYERASKRYEKVFLCTGLQEMISSCLSRLSFISNHKTLILVTGCEIHRIRLNLQ